MHEQEQYECFAVPAHVWSSEDTIAEEQAPAGWTRRNWVYREGAADLGAETMPAPAVEVLKIS